MRRILCHLVVVFFAFAAQKPAIAEDNSADLALRLFELSRTDQSMEQMLLAFSSSMRESFNALLQQQDAELSNELTDEFHAIVEDEMSQSMDDMMGPLRDTTRDFYVDNFTTEELAMLVDLYGSPAFQKQLDLLPKMMQRSTELALELQGPMQTRLMERLAGWAKKVEQQQ